MNEVCVEKLDSVIEHILTYMSLSEIEQDGPAFHKIPMKWFSDAQPFVNEWMDTFSMARSGDANSDIFMDAKPSDVGNFDTCILAQLFEDDSREVRYSPEEGNFSLQRIRRVPLKDVRGLFSAKTGIIAEYTVGCVMADAKYHSARRYFEYRGGRWYQVANQAALTPTVVNKEHGHIQLAMGLAFTRQYQWTVSMGWEGCPSVMFPTDPVGAREAFRLRDIPNGKSRRAALRHWVSGHWRQSRTDPAEESKVRAHLRGATEFNWNGLTCRIKPSAEDVKSTATKTLAR
jgi:hypothetical protein